MLDKDKFKSIVNVGESLYPKYKKLNITSISNAFATDTVQITATDPAGLSDVETCLENTCLCVCFHKLCIF